ncbi:MAG: hypothetical protein N2234_01320 [Planctomycetota bacterium]|nr:hypothetical protein [Planctomycetota bacterium]
MQEGARKEKRPQTLFGRIAVELGFINAEQLSECVRLQGQTNPRKRLGEIMLEKGFITVEQLAEIIQVQQQSLAGNMRYAEEHLQDSVMGKIAVKKGYCTEEQINEALRAQALREESGIFCRLGEILVEKGFLTSEKVIEILKLQRKELMVCTGCKRRYNVFRYEPTQTYICKYCKKPLQIPEDSDNVQVDTTLFFDEGKTQ